MMARGFRFMPPFIMDGSLLAATAALCAILGGGAYEHLVVDPCWPKRPDLIQPMRGGISRGRFWLPAHTLFEAVLILSLVLSWKLPNVRFWLWMAIAVHVATRIWSAVDFIPKAFAFEKAAVVDEAVARRWTMRSKFRLPMELLTLTFLFNAVRLAFAR
jgi:hypothetical protein